MAEATAADISDGGAEGRFVKPEPLPTTKAPETVPVTFKLPFNVWLVVKTLLRDNIATLAVREAEISAALTPPDDSPVNKLPLPLKYEAVIWEAEMFAETYKFPVIT